MPGWLVDGVVEGNTMLAAGHGATVTDEVARLTGRPPGTFASLPPIIEWRSGASRPSGDRAAAAWHQHQPTLGGLSGGWCG